MLFFWGGTFFLEKEGPSPDPSSKKAAFISQMRLLLQKSGFVAFRLANPLLS